MPPRAVVIADYRPRLARDGVRSRLVVILPDQIHQIERQRLPLRAIHAEIIRARLAVPLVLVRLADNGTAPVPRTGRLDLAETRPVEICVKCDRGEQDWKHRGNLNLLSVIIYAMTLRVLLA